MRRLYVEALLELHMLTTLCKDVDKVQQSDLLPR